MLIAAKRQALHVLAGEVGIPIDASMTHRIFISHASEDKDSIARPLAHALRKQDFQVWYDEFVLELGDSLKRSIDRGLSDCDFGVVILSEYFFSKHWPQEELGGLVARESAKGEKLILPIWHNIDAEGIRRFSPTLADRIAISSDEGVDTLVKKIADAVRSETKRLHGTTVEFVSPFGARLQVTGYPNRPTFDLEEAFRRGEFEGKFQDRIRDIFSTEKMEKIIGGIEKELKDTTLKKKK